MCRRLLLPKNYEAPLFTDMYGQWPLAASYRVETFMLPLFEARLN